MNIFKTAIILIDYYLKVRLQVSILRVYVNAYVMCQIVCVVVGGGYKEGGGGRERDCAVGNQPFIKLIASIRY